MRPEKKVVRWRANPSHLLEKKFRYFLIIFLFIFIGLKEIEIKLGDIHSKGNCRIRKSETTKPFIE